MSKFKVGDKVRVLPYDKKFLCTGIGEQALKKIAGNLYTITDVRNGGVTKHWYYFAETKYVLTEEMLELSEHPRREFIVIRRDGAKTIAELRHDREVIKSGTATCAPSDTFDFNTGAKLAFDRLMGREEPKPAPAPEPTKFYTGKVVCVEDDYNKPHLLSNRVGKIFYFINGYLKGKNHKEFSVEEPERIESVEQLNRIAVWTRWIEVKD